MKLKPVYGEQLPGGKLPLSFSNKCLALAAQFKAMRLKNIVGMGIAAMLAISCGAPKVLTSYKTDANTFTEAKDYAQATSAWKNYFDQTPVEETAGADYATAAKTAFLASQADLALAWFDQARYKNYADLEMYQNLAEVYQQKDNLSKELNALEYICENYVDQTGKTDSRLFDVYHEIESYDKAKEVWNRLSDDTKGSVTKLERYFTIQKALKETTSCDSLALVLLEKNPEHIDALEWNAKKLYWLGENRYQEAMQVYEKKKSTKQYRILLKELDLATADFKKSLVYFEKLWTEGNEKKYASYFANIYARFGDEKKSAYYKDFVN